MAGHSHRSFGAGGLVGRAWPTRGRVAAAWAGGQVWSEQTDRTRVSGRRQPHETVKTLDYPIECFVRSGADRCRDSGGAEKAWVKRRSVWNGIRKGSQLSASEIGGQAEQPKKAGPSPSSLTFCLSLRRSSTHLSPVDNPTKPIQELTFARSAVRPLSIRLLGWWSGIGFLRPRRPRVSLARLDHDGHRSVREADRSNKLDQLQRYQVEPSGD